jgi:hypothetical protein
MTIEGSWYNELGSTMEIRQEGSTISGTYCTAVGDAEGTYSLLGQINIKPSQGGQAVAWCVVWTNTSGHSDSTTSWCGQYQTVEGIEEISTFWLLTSEQLPANDWRATNIGQDTFSRSKPTPEQMASANKRKATSHPA